ncbi:conserved hypothetical protein [Methanocaldococcus sp. FS406-22]|uniref:hypothetical protein n=1 Tax=Methanocaldococcus sp. (strain FS406-22) TaxID=644281 RepID=UPI0001BF34FC|nr:hypothetical protein [Methanocaldococcus sp. FS406-22]ADC69812.1 conserved hypothetical protein [Methanocaldococcus sp. FS406-22]
MKKLPILTILLILITPAIAKTITLVNPETGETKTFYINETNDTTLPDNITIVIKHVVEVEGNQTVIVYDANMIAAYQALIAELQRNITRLQEELNHKNQQLAELITYKKKNIELQKNISKLKSEITMLKAENELLKEQNKQYKDLITDLIEKSSNSTLQEAIEKEKAENKRWNATFTALGIAVVGVCALGLILRRYIKRHECPL